MNYLNIDLSLHENNFIGIHSKNVSKSKYEFAINYDFDYYNYSLCS